MTPPEERHLDASLSALVICHQQENAGGDIRAWVKEQLPSLAKPRSQALQNEFLALARLARAHMESYPRRSSGMSQAEFAARQFEYLAHMPEPRFRIARLLRKKLREKDSPF